MSSLLFHLNQNGKTIMANFNNKTLSVCHCCDYQKISRLVKLLLFLLFINLNSVSAQDSLVVQYAVNARATFKQGRLKQTNIALDGSLKLEKEKWSLDLFTNYNYLKTNGRVGENEWFSRALISFFQKRKLFPVIGNMYFKSEFYQIDSRKNPGVGLGYKLVDKNQNYITLYGWLAYDETKFKNIPKYDTFRITGFLSGNYELLKNKVSTQFVFYYLQSLEQASNYIWRIEPTILFHLSQKFSLSLNYRNHFENIIDPSNEKQNTALTIGIKFQNI